MPEETIQTESSQAEESSTSVDSSFTNDSTGTLSSTTEAEPSVEEAETQNGVDEEQGDEEDRPYTKEELKKLDLTFQQSPRFQKLQEQKEELFRQNVELEAELKAIKNLSDDFDYEDEQSQPKTDFVDVTTLTDEAVIETFNSNPQKFMGNLARQIRHEVLSEVKAESQASKQREAAAKEQAEINKVYEQYEKANPDFYPMFESGELQAYMDKNPGTTLIAAHKELTLSSRIEAAVAEKVKELSEKKKKTITKEPARTIGGGPQNGSSKAVQNISPDLKDTKKYGGLAAVLTNRSLARTKGG